MQSQLQLNENLKGCASAADPSYQWRWSDILHTASACSQSHASSLITYLVDEFESVAYLYRQCSYYQACALNIRVSDGPCCCHFERASKRGLVFGFLSERCTLRTGELILSSLLGLMGLFGWQISLVCLPWSEDCVELLSMAFVIVTHQLLTDGNCLIFVSA